MGFMIKGVSGRPRTSTVLIRSKFATQTYSSGIYKDVHSGASLRSLYRLLTKPPSNSWQTIYIRGMWNGPLYIFPLSGVERLPSRWK